MTMAGKTATRLTLGAVFLVGGVAVLGCSADVPDESSDRPASGDESKKEEVGTSKQALANGYCYTVQWSAGWHVTSYTAPDWCGYLGQVQPGYQLCQEYQEWRTFQNCGGSPGYYWYSEGNIYNQSGQVVGSGWVRTAALN